MANKVIFAEKEATVHILSGTPEQLPDGSLLEPREARILLPGETLSLDEVPSYVKNSVMKGEAPGLSLLTEFQVKNRLRERAILLGEVNPLESSKEPEVSEEIE